MSEIERVVAPTSVEPACPAALRVAEASGGTGAVCGITRNLIDSRHNPSTLTSFCFNCEGYRMCPTWRADKEEIWRTKTIKDALSAQTRRLSRVEAAGAARKASGRSGAHRGNCRAYSGLLIAAGRRRRSSTPPPRAATRRSARRGSTGCRRGVAAPPEPRVLDLAPRSGGTRPPVRCRDEAGR